ncbi:carboxypeptidase-like regulatory domain-containing protein [Wenyingzhuangia sp. IMCC45574]
MKINNLTKTITLVLFFFSSIIFAQKRIFSGVLKDKNGYPLIGATISVKGKNKLTITDFDGNYSIACEAGDILKIEYLGYKNKSITVTEKMLEDSKVNRTKLKNKKEEVKAGNTSTQTITSNAFSEMFNPRKKNIIGGESNATHSYKSYPNTHRLKRIEIDSTEINLVHYDSDIHYSLEYNRTAFFRFVTKRNLPELQNTYTQGRPIAGTLSYQGPDQNEMFSFGPTLESQNLTNHRTSIFQNSITAVNDLKLSVFSKKHDLKIDYTHLKQPSIFEQGKNIKNLINTNYSYKTEKNKFSFLFFYKNLENTQPNINGFNSNVIRSSFSTPTSFNNQKLKRVENSFNPNSFNNPLGLLYENNNSFKSDNISYSIKDELLLFDDVLKIRPILNYQESEKNLSSYLPVNTVGFEQGYTSHKEVLKKNLSPELHIRIGKNRYRGFSYLFSGGSNISKANYNFLESDRILNTTTFNNSRNLAIERTTSWFANRIDYSFGGDIDGIVSLANHSTFSSKQGNQLLQPTIRARMNFEYLFSEFLDWLYIDDFVNQLSIAGAYSSTVGEAPLLYENTSHSSLLFNPIDSYSYTANDELAINNDLRFEKYENYHFTLETGLFRNRVTLELTKSFKNVTGSIIPFITDSGFKLQNIADTRTESFDAELVWRNMSYSRKLRHNLKLSFSSYKIKVDKLWNNEQSIPIAGFKNVSKNLIEGKPAGVIVGTAYKRDENNNIIIGNDGFPLVDEQLKVIGNPNPDFNMSISNTLKYKGFDFKIVLDIQKGGDVWNGTQQALNYLGTSQETANQRERTNYVFNGVTSSGSINTTPVNFVDLNGNIENNRWSRYGYTGIDEEAIEDGSYLNLKTIALGYKPTEKFIKKTGLESIHLSVYGNNLLTFTKYRGASPYTNLFDAAKGSGLQFFNTPMISEVGCRIHLKF